MAGKPITGFEFLEYPIRVVPPKKRGSGRVWYRPNRRSFGAFIRSDQMRDVTAEVAEDIADLAKHLSPVSDKPSKADHMRDHFTVKKDAGFIKVAGNVRVKVEVVNEDPAAAPNEFGTARNARHRMLARAGAIFGDFKPEGGLDA